MSKKLHTPQFVDKLCAAQAAMELARHNSSNPHFRRTYADMQSVIEATLPAFTNAGLAIYQDVSQGDESVTATTVITDGVVTIEVAPVTVPTKGTNGQVSPQSIGSALTYARRYSWMTATGVPVGDDRDSVDQQPSQQQQTQEPASPASREAPASSQQPSTPSGNWQRFTNWLTEQIRTLTDVSEVIGVEATEQSVVSFIRSNGIGGWGAFQDYLVRQWSGQGEGPPETDEQPTMDVGEPTQGNLAGH